MCIRDSLYTLHIYRSCRRSTVHAVDHAVHAVDLHAVTSCRRSRRSCRRSARRSCRRSTVLLA
eukprot:9435383-Heterocapsa_arctica.AAC.1